MKKFTFGIFVLLGLLFSSQLCQAAFPVHSANPSAVTASTENNAVMKSKARLVTTTAPGRQKIDQIIYIILAIIPLGGALAMGLNDGFTGNDWLIALIGYFLFYFPGLIWTLYKMNKYY